MQRVILECCRKHKYVYEGELLDGLSCPECNNHLHPIRLLKGSTRPAELKGVEDYKEVVKQRKKKYRYRAQCLICKHSDMVIHDSVEDYNEVEVCPKCNGAFVDVFKIVKYESKSKLSNVTVNCSLHVDDKQIEKALNDLGEALKNSISFNLGL